MAGDFSETEFKTTRGYAHPGYAKSLSEFGVPCHLPRCSGWMLKRTIPDSDERDAMGPYPIFACGDWSKLSTDLAALEDELVSFAAVLDPFGDYNSSCLQECFPDLVLPFKDHFVTELSNPLESYVGSHHRRNARKALQHISVEVSENPENHIEDWLRLYDNLVHRHAIQDLRRFSPCSFAQQFKVPGMVVFRATHQGKAVGMSLFYGHGDVAYYHLGAYNAKGYELKASFALFWTALEYFTAKQFQWLNLGAGAGTDQDADDGLSRFKRGWSTGTRTAYFCGRILNPDAYARLVVKTGNLSTNYFPAYRQGEFCKKKPAAPTGELIQAK